MTGSDTFLGLDLGTSGLRGLLTTSDGAVIGSAEAVYAVDRPHPGWSEQNPDDWRDALKRVVDTLGETHGAAFSRLAGIAVSGHMHGAVLLGADNAVLRPCILWNDTRSHAEAAVLDAKPDVRAVSGNIVFPGFTAPKLAWIARNEPDVFLRTAKVLLPKDFMTFHLTGDHVGDMSDAAGTSWLDVGARAWSPRLLELCGMRVDQMPRLVEGTQTAGTLRPDLARAWGLDHPVVVAGGGGDNAAAACGVGALSEGEAFVSLGTSGVLLAARDSFAPQPDTAVHTFCHAVPERWYQMGVILAATDSLNWLGRQLGQDPADLTAALGDTIADPGAVQFLPYISGERTPHNDSAVRGAFLNLDVSNEPSDLTRAVLEGVAFALRDSLEALAATGARIDRLLGVGGGTQSLYWVELLATVLNLPIDLPAEAELGAAMGAARLARCAKTGEAPDAVMLKPKIAQTVQPREALVDAYASAYANWRKLYPLLKQAT